MCLTASCSLFGFEVYACEPEQAFHECNCMLLKQLLCEKALPFTGLLLFEYIVHAF